MFRPLAIVALLAACTVDRAIPNARLACKDDSTCPGGSLCRPSGGRMVCCLGGSCGSVAGTDGGGAEAPVSRDGSGADTAGVDAGCIDCAVALTVESADERDLATGCAGDLCVVGGITP
jgi:hypothetical protein